MSSTIFVKKRERTQNWIPEEKNVLFELIKRHASAIENKRVDAGASAMKTLAWQRIHRAFRGRFTTVRDITRMREQWRRMKAQARMEIYGFVEKLKNSTLEEATKHRPSNLSIEVWRLMESTRKNETDERSDDSCQETITENSTMTIKQILDGLSTSSSEGVRNQVKIEINSDENTDDEVGPCDLERGLQGRTDSRKEDEPIDLAERRSTDGTTKLSNREELVKRTERLYETAVNEHDLKLKVLKVELERAELQKQAAVNELKTSGLKRQLVEDQATEYYNQMRMSGQPGSGAGRGGGGGGAIREAGGSFGKMEAAHEDQYFYNQQKEQLQKLKEDLHDEISFHEEQIKRHQEAINRHKKRITDMHKE